MTTAPLTPAESRKAAELFAGMDRLDLYRWGLSYQRDKVEGNEAQKAKAIALLEVMRAELDRRGN
jgi:hypothetical protein